MPSAAEMGKYGITINIIAPDPIQTGYLTPEDVADVIVLLASEQAHWLTGQLLYFEGGWRMHQ